MLIHKAKKLQVKSALQIFNIIFRKELLILIDSDNGTINLKWIFFEIS